MHAELVSLHLVGCTTAGGQERCTGTSRRQDSPGRLSDAWRMGDIHAKICDEEFALFTTKSQLRPESNRIEICEKPVRSGSPGLEPSAGKICVGRPDGSGACVGLVSAAEDAATVNVVVGSSGSVSVDVGVSVVDGCEATASEVSVTNVNCELTEGVTASENDVEVALNETEDEKTDGKLMIVPLVEAEEVRFALTPVVMLALAENVVVELSEIVTVELSLTVIETPPLDVLELPGAPVMEALGIIRCQ